MVTASRSRNCRRVIDAFAELVHEFAITPGTHRSDYTRETVTQTCENPLITAPLLSVKVTLNKPTIEGGSITVSG